MSSNLLFFAVVILIGASFVLLTVVLGLFFKKRIIKYIPSMVMGIAAIGFFIKSRYFSQGFEDIGYMIFAVIAFAYFLATVITAIIMKFAVNKSR